MAGKPASRADDRLISINPANGEAVGSVSVLRPREIDGIVERAWTAFRRSGWAQMRPDRKAAVLHEVARRLLADKERLARLQMLDNGKPLAECRAMIDAERARVLEIRRSGTVSSDVVADVLARLDVEESMLEVSNAEREEIAQANRARRPGGDTCPDLARYPASPTPEGDLACVDCLVEGTRWVALRRCLECGHTFGPPRE